MIASESTVAARLRRAAVRQNYQLKKNCTRDPLSPIYGTYRLIDMTGKRPDPIKGVQAGRGAMTLAQVADYLHQGR